LYWKLFCAMSNKCTGKDLNSLEYLAVPGSTVVRLSTLNPKNNSSNPATGTGREEDKFSPKRYSLFGLEQKVIPGTNALAYFAMAFTMKKKVLLYSHELY
jgi:hypothetical protein